MAAFDAILLTGGSARRLGGADKPALVVGSGAMVLGVAAAVQAAGRLIVVGPAHPQLLPDVVTREDPPGSGPVAAIAAALPHVRASYVALMAADLPFLRAPVVAGLHAAAAGHDAAVLQDADGRAQWLCAVWSVPALTAALGTGDPAGRSMRSVYAGADVALLQAGTASLPAEPPPWFDVDTDADLARAREWADSGERNCP